MAVQKNPAHGRGLVVKAFALAVAPPASPVLDWMKTGGRATQEVKTEGFAVTCALAPDAPRLISGFRS
jgi:hypothetical protein